MLCACLPFPWCSLFPLRHETSLDNISHTIAPLRAPVSPCQPHTVES